MRSIGIDIDDTVFYTASYILVLLGRFFNEYFPLERLTKYSIEDCLHIDKEIVEDAVDLAISNPDLKSFEDADRIIKWLSEWYNIHFITFRKPKFVSETIELLDKLCIPYFLHMCDKKSEIINNEGICVHIEDRPNTIKDIYDNTDCTILVYDRPWNVNIKQNGRIIRVYSWQDIYNFFIIKGDFDKGD